MKANNLTICLPFSGCDKNCPYCISRITGAYSSVDKSRWDDNLKKARKFAESCGITSVLLTSKGEPMLYPSMVKQVISFFSEYPVEIQTNGLALLKILNNTSGESSFLNYLRRFVNVLAFSLDDFSQFDMFSELFRYFNKDIVLRVTFNLTDNLPSSVTYDDFIDKCIEYDVRQFTLRKVVAPVVVADESDEAKTVRKWIEDNTKKDHLFELIGLSSATFERCPDPDKMYPIRQLSFGPIINDYRGIAVTNFTDCVQEVCSDGTIRSLIYLDDGHLYTSWNSRASILF